MLELNHIKYSEFITYPGSTLSVSSDFRICPILKWIFQVTNLRETRSFIPYSDMDMKRDKWFIQFTIRAWSLNKQSNKKWENIINVRKRDYNVNNLIPLGGIVKRRDTVEILQINEWQSKLNSLTSLSSSHYTNSILQGKRRPKTGLLMWMNYLRMTCCLQVWGPLFFFRKSNLAPSVIKKMHGSW